MNYSIADIKSLMDLENLEQNFFRGQSQDFGSGNVFGGQVLGQSLVAASRTLPKGRNSIAHSLHAYFLRPGDMKFPIMYDVDRIRDGRSFDTRRVRAIQHGRPIFNMSASFQMHEEGFEHQAEMPSVPGPDSLKSELEIRKSVAARKNLPDQVKMRFLHERPIETRPVDQDIEHYFTSMEKDPNSHIWIRSEQSLPDDPVLHQALLAYVSDMSLLGTSMRPHGITFMNPKIQGASLDHAMWFHRPYRIDEWLLYATDSPSASGGRGFNRGSIYTQDGILVASVAQEGLIRYRGS
ncbi:MAG: acyl-CoA thioesterase II [Gammaproteobacteria bacterium]